MPLGGWSVFPDPAGPSWQVPAGLSWQVPAGRSSPESGPDRGTAEPPWPSCTALRDARAKVRTLVFSRRRRGSPGEGQARGGDDEVGRPKVEAAERRDLEAGGVDDGEVVPVPGAAPPVEVARGVFVEEAVEPIVVAPAVLEEEDPSAGPRRSLERDERRDGIVVRAEAERVDDGVEAGRPPAAREPLDGREARRDPGIGRGLGRHHAPELGLGTRQGLALGLHLPGDEVVGVHGVHPGADGRAGGRHLLDNLGREELVLNVRRDLVDHFLRDVLLAKLPMLNTATFPLNASTAWMAPLVQQVRQQVRQSHTVQGLRISTRLNTICCSRDSSIRTV